MVRTLAKLAGSSSRFDCHPHFRDNLHDPEHGLHRTRGAFSHEASGDSNRGRHRETGIALIRGKG